MSKAKRFVVIISALSLAGVATAGLANSSCGTSVSGETAACLSTKATTNFLNSYTTYCAGQCEALSSSGGGSAMFSTPNTSDNSYYSQAQPSNTAANPSSTNNNSSKQGSNWF